VFENGRDRFDRAIDVNLAWTPRYAVIGTNLREKT
jgi:hypothetical protein